MFVPLHKHAARIVEVLALREDPMEWFGVCEWLQVAASVEKVAVNTARFNSSYGWCSSADEYDDAREELLRRFVHEYSIFSFIWGAIESSLTLISPPKHPVKAKRGKIRDAAYYLRAAFETRAEVSGLTQEVSLFCEAARSCLGSTAVDGRLAELGEFGGAGIGLYVVYELRNQFAHGAIEFPEPDEENRPISDHESMVSHASRVALLQLQMLLLAYLQPNDEPVLFGREIGAASAEVPLYTALRACHLARTDESFQLPLLADA
jgi:hypothetical protein